MATKKAMRTRTDVSNDIENSENASLRRSSRSTKSAISENSPKSPPSAAPKTTMDLMPSELSAIFCELCPEIIGIFSRVDSFGKVEPVLYLPSPA